jgi:sugar/nucleoside kinase (ribokinase family)
MYDVITIGSSTVDVYGIVNKGYNEIKKGDKVLISKLDFEIGGGGVNSAVALKRMGLKAAFLGKLGKDHNAYMVRRDLKNEKIEIINTKESDDFTSYSFILVSQKQGDRIIYTYKGASDHLKYNEIPLGKLKQTKWIYMATMLGDSFKTCEKIADFAKKNGIFLLFNPSTYLAAKGKNYLKNILKNTEALVLNKSEAKLLLNTKSDNIIELAKGLYKLGPKIIAITDGAKNIHAYNGKCLYIMKPYKVKVVSTAGAGDAFTSGFLAGIIHRNDFVHALELGMANAASVLQYYGTHNKLLTYEEALKFIKIHKGGFLKKKC